MDGAQPQWSTNGGTIVAHSGFEIRSSPGSPGIYFAQVGPAGNIGPMTKIEDYALLGDCHSSALVSKDGSVDWACFPAFDSPSVFCKVLDEKKGGAWQIAPVEEYSVRRSYIDDTNVLTTVFVGANGTLELTDCMPIARLDPADPTKVTNYSSILRRLRCAGGSIRVRMHLAARFEYGSFTPRFRMTSEQTCEIAGGADALWVTSTRPMKADYEHLEAEWEMKSGDEIWVEAAWSSAFEERESHEHPTEADLRKRLADTMRFWREWIAQCWYRGDYAEQVRRSALVLKMLTYAPTGAVVAAPTTSLPEEIGGVRNWDYRYTWIRDTTVTLISLLVLGFREEADAYRQWLRRTSSGRPQDLQIMYGIQGRRALPEIELTHLAGHRDSAPVRIGNGAVKQLQLDSYGQLLEAAYLYLQMGGSISPTNWEFLRGLVNLCREKWRNPDQGIWEIRDEPRHFTHSKLLCWTALDRGIKIAEGQGLAAPVEEWKRERDVLVAYLMDDANTRGHFTQAVGTSPSDASILLIPAMGFLAPRDPLWLKTLAQLREELETDGFVHRYHAGDGLEGGEGGFLLCSFWLIDALIHAGELDEAEKILEQMMALANDVGLYAEEAVPETGEALGNFPQAFTHMALVTTCAHITAARRGELPESGAYDFCEFAMQRLMQQNRRGPGTSGPPA